MPIVRSALMATHFAACPRAGLTGVPPVLAAVLLGKNERVLVMPTRPLSYGNPRSARSRDQAAGAGQQREVPRRQGAPAWRPLAQAPGLTAVLTTGLVAWGAFPALASAGAFRRGTSGSGRVLRVARQRQARLDNEVVEKLRATPSGSSPCTSRGDAVRVMREKWSCATSRGNPSVHDGSLNTGCQLSWPWWGLAGRASPHVQVANRGRRAGHPA